VGLGLRVREAVCAAPGELRLVLVGERFGVADLDERVLDRDRLGVLDHNAAGIEDDEVGLAWI
jgi:hypothetical protein